LPPQESDIHRFVNPYSHPSPYFDPPVLQRGLTPPSQQR
jgi:hypothetical protein